VASHPDTRTLFLNAHIPLYLYPFLNTQSVSRPFEYLRLTSLGVIGALVKVDDSEVISFLLQVRVFCLVGVLVVVRSLLFVVVLQMVLVMIAADDGVDITNGWSANFATSPPPRACASAFGVFFCLIRLCLCFCSCSYPCSPAVGRSVGWSVVEQTEIIPLCLRIMETGTELSKTVATFIVQKILLDDMGLNYICQTVERFYAVATVLNRMVEVEAEAARARDNK
jgi:hypothetical protein